MELSIIRVKQKYVLDETIYEGLNMNRSIMSSDEQNSIVGKKLNKSTFSLEKKIIARALSCKVK